jgi:type II secretory pathway component PulJ
VEILVATVAMAILMVALHGVFSSGIRLRDRATERIQEVRLRERAERALRRDLRHALVTGGRIAAGLEGSKDAPASRFPGYFRFTTATAPTTGDAFHADLQEVEYFIIEDPWSTNQQGGTLVRTLDRNLMASVREIEREETLLRNVESLEISFFDGENWVDSWEFVDTESSLPQAVEVVVRQAEQLDQKGTPSPPIQVLVPWSVQVAAETGEEEETEEEEDWSGGNESDGDRGPPGGDGGGGTAPPAGGGR